MTVETKPKVKIAPNSKESEMMVLGSMLTSQNALSVGVESLSNQDFYYAEHKEIFNELKELYRKDKPADVHIICESLRDKEKLKKIGGPAYITTLAQYAGTSAHVEEYCNIIRRKSYSRQALNTFQEAENDFLKDPEYPEKLTEKYHQKLVDLSKRYSPNDKASIGEILSGNKSRIDPIPTIERLKSRQEYYKEHGESCLTGLPTGFIDIDKKVTLLEDTNLIVIAGRPAMGKTAFALNILSNICFEQGASVGFISLEMGADQLVERMLSARSGVGC